MGIGSWLREQWNAEAPSGSFPGIESKSVFDFEPTNTSGWPIASASPALLDSLQLYSTEPSSYINVYRSHPSVYTVIEFLAWQASQVGIKTYRRKSDTDRPELHDHIVSKTLKDPAPGLTYERLIHSTVADLCVFGNAYWRKMTKGDMRWIVPLPPPNITPKGGTLLGASKYLFSIGGSRTLFDASEIVHFRRYNPEDPRIGVSPLEPLRRILAEESASGANREGLWRNAARVEGIIERPPAETSGEWSDDARSRFRTDWQNIHAGESNAGKTAILEDGMTWKAASFSPKDTEFIAGRKLTLETVARAFNIPLAVLGLTESATYASQREFHKALYQDTLAPWLKMLQGEIAMGVVPWLTDEPDVYAEFNIAEKLRGSFEEQADSLRQYIGVPVMTVKEGRALLNLPELPDEPDFDVPVKPANVIYGGAGSDGQPVPAAVPMHVVDAMPPGKARAKEQR